MGRSTSEIAEALYISPSTVSFHRKNLRRKLGLAPRGPRLASHLGADPDMSPIGPEDRGERWFDTVPAHAARRPESSAVWA